MARVLYPDTAYSFRRLHAVIVGDAAAADTQVLARIEQLLVAAGEAFRARRYLDAIDDYTAVRRLVWSQLYPVSHYREVDVRKVDLYRTLVSYSGEWMNVLPVETALEGVRPREIAKVEDAPVIGLRSKTAGVDVTRAAADLSTARSLERVGNAVAARFFRDRAAANAPTLVNAEASVPRTSPAVPARRPARCGCGQPDRERRRPRVERGGHLACASTPKWAFRDFATRELWKARGLRTWSPPGPRGRRAILRREAPHPGTPTPAAPHQRQGRGVAPLEGGIAALRGMSRRINGHPEAGIPPQPQ